MSEEKQITADTLSEFSFYDILIRPKKEGDLEKLEVYYIFHVNASDNTRHELYLLVYYRRPKLQWWDDQLAK